MKIPILALALIALAVTGLEAQQAQTQATQVTAPAPTPYTIVKQDGNSRVWERQEYEVGPNGEVVTNIHSFVELQSGMNFRAANGQFKGSTEEICILPDGTAAATNGQHHVKWPINILNGLIQVTTPDGLQLNSQPVGLVYYDGTNAAFLAVLTNSVGQLISSNKILYTNAFSGLKADILYEYTRAGFSQDIVIRQKPPSPASLGLNPATTRLQMWTEFINPPTPAIQSMAPAVGAAIPLVDQSIGFGAMKMTRGHAFLLGKHARSAGTMVSKTWVQIDGRHFLVEEMPLSAVQRGLAELPLTAMNNKSEKVKYLASRQLKLPKHRQIKADAGRISIAKANTELQGFELDYMEMNTGQTNFTFRSDTTYYISGEVNLAGVTTFEGGTVIKYNGTNSIVNILDTANFMTDSYRPAVFTSVFDNSVGENVTADGGTNESSTGSPCAGPFDLTVYNDTVGNFTVYIYDDYGNYYVNGGSLSDSGDNDFYFNAVAGQHYVYDSYAGSPPYEVEYSYDFWPTLNNGIIYVNPGQPTDGYSETGPSLCSEIYQGTSVALSFYEGGNVHNARFCNLGTGISSEANYSVQDAQFVNCGTALDSEGASLFAGNILISSNGTAFYGQTFQVVVNNATIDQAKYLTADPINPDYSSFIVMTNCIITGSTNWGSVSVSTNFVVFSASSSGIYQSAGAGNYYLASGSQYRAVGSTNIDP